jgi:hypothetical protein
MKPAQDNAAGLNNGKHRYGDPGGNESVFDRPGDAGEYENGRAEGISQDRMCHGCVSCSFLDAFSAKTRRKTFPPGETAGK